MSEKPTAIFCRIMPDEMKAIDNRARTAMRSRTNYAANELHRVVTDQKQMPTNFPDPAPNAESVVLFLRVSPELKLACAVKAAEANLPLSRWVRGVLLGS